MSTEARLKREGDIEALRAYWRAKARRQYARHRDKILARQKVYQARYRTLHPRERTPRKEPSLLSLVCHGCGIAFARSRSHTSRTMANANPYCTLACYRTNRPKTAHPLARYTGKSCRIWSATCPECHRLFTAHGNQRFCQSRCTSRYLTREYMRRTRYTAIRYWAIDKSPEALALASTYFELRQELRMRSANG